MAAVRCAQWPESDTFEKELQERLHPEVGDCRQELVFIGIDVDEPVIRNALEECLLTDEDSLQESWPGNV